MTIPAADVIKLSKEKLVDGIGGLAAFLAPEIPVSWSHPGSKLEAVGAWVGDFRGKQEWKTIGGGHKGIAGDSAFEFFIFVSRQGGTAEDVEREALDLCAAVEEWLRFDVTAGIDVLADLPGCTYLLMAVDSVSLEGGFDDQARAALVSADISLTARI